MSSTYNFDGRKPCPYKSNVASSKSLAADDIKVLPERKDQ